MDGLDFHPYPIPQSLPFATGLRGPDRARASRTCRGSTRPSTTASTARRSRRSASRPAAGCRSRLNEVGIQTDSTGQPGLRRHRDRARTPPAACSAQYRDRGLPVVVVPADAAARRLRPERPARQHLPPDRRGELSRAGRAASTTSTGRRRRRPRPCTTGSRRPAAPARARCTRGRRPACAAARAAAARRAAGRAGRGSSSAPPGASAIFDAATHALRRVLAPFGAALHRPALARARRRQPRRRRRLRRRAGPRGSGRQGPERQDRRPLARYTPFAAAFQAGVSVALGDVNGDGRADLVVGTGAGAPAQVKVYDAQDARACSRR